MYCSGLGLNTRVVEDRARITSRPCQGQGSRKIRKLLVTLVINSDTASIVMLGNQWYVRVYQWSKAATQQGSVQEQTSLISLLSPCLIQQYVYI